MVSIVLCTASYCLDRNQPLTRLCFNNASPARLQQVVLRASSCEGRYGTVDNHDRPSYCLGGFLRPSRSAQHPCTSDDMHWTGRKCRCKADVRSYGLHSNLERWCRQRLCTSMCRRSYLMCTTAPHLAKFAVSPVSPDFSLGLIYQFHPHFVRTLTLQMTRQCFLSAQLISTGCVAEGDVGFCGPFADGRAFCFYPGSMRGPPPASQGRVSHGQGLQSRVLI